VLIVDDTKSNTYFIKQLLDKSQFEGGKLEILSLEDGALAVELFRNSNLTKQETNIDLIIMDMNMNGMNGDDATRQVANC
jgi:CheY-like chemotaxis protein